MLSSKKRLRASDVEKVLKRGFSLYTGGVRLKLMPREGVASPSRFAVIVSKKITKGSAVDRNRLRRQAYSALSRVKSFAKPHDVALTLNRFYTTQKEMESDIKEALSQKVI